MIPENKISMKAAISVRAAIKNRKIIRYNSKKIAVIFRFRISKSTNLGWIFLYIHFFPNHLIMYISSSNLYRKNLFTYIYTVIRFFLQHYLRNILN